MSLGHLLELSKATARVDPFGLLRAEADSSKRARNHVADADSRR